MASTTIISITNITTVTIETVMIKTFHNPLSRSRFPGRILASLIFPLLALGACGASGKSSSAQASETRSETSAVVAPAFDADSAYSYVARQVEFGPRVPNTEAHRRAGDWLVAELRRHGAEVTEQTPVLTAFDGTQLKTRNIFASFKPGEPRRLLLVAHWDCRPWADEDPDPARRKLPVDGANDGASGVGVLLEAARQMKTLDPSVGVDILFVDAEDWGAEGEEDSWALGTKYFAANPPRNGYSPAGAVVLDMVGAPDAVFPREYFSQTNAPALVDAFWSTAGRLGHGDLFPQTMGSAVTDDHVELLKAGIPAIDIIDYRDGSGFCPQWHTAADDMTGISRETLGKVGGILLQFVKDF